MVANDNHLQSVHVSTDDTFVADIASGVSLVDFWAEWCGPCQMMIPRLATLAERLAGRARIIKLNVDDNQNTAMQFRVMSIPTMIIFVDGKAVEQIVGVRSVDELEKALEKHLAGGAKIVA